MSRTAIDDTGRRLFALAAGEVPERRTGAGAHRHHHPADALTLDFDRAGAATDDRAEKVGDGPAGYHPDDRRVLAIEAAPLVTNLAHVRLVDPLDQLVAAEDEMGAGP